MSKKEFVIPFVGLKIGTHEFEYDINDSFFERFEYSIIEGGSLKVKLSLDKKETMMVGNFSITGSVKSNCDRCTEPVKVEIEGEYQLIFKFDDTPSDDEMLVVIFPEEFEIDMSEHILELTTVSLPARMVHDEGECNEDMLDLLDEYSVREDDDENDPRWDALKKLK